MSAGGTESGKGGQTMSMTSRILAICLLVLCFVGCTDADLCPEPLDAHPHRAVVSYSFNWDNVSGSRPDSMYVLAYRVINQWKSSVAVESNGSPARGHYVWHVLDDEPSMTETPTGEGPGEGDVTGDESGERDDTGEGSGEGDGTGEGSEEGDDTGDGSEEGGATRDEPEVGDGSEEEPEVEEPIAEEPEPEVRDTTRFALKSGDYKFVTFNVQDEELDFSRVNEYLRSDTMHLQSLDISYKTYIKGDDALRFTIPDWVDYNAYGSNDRYMQPSTQAVYYDTISVRSLRSNGEYHINFANPRRLTQHIEILFDVRKEVYNVPFTVDSVFAEISGIPYTINLSTGYIDIAQTKKMMFKMGIARDVASGEDPTDTEDNTLLHCSAAIDVPSIVKSASDDLLMGPGIMQVMIFCSAEDPLDTSQRLNKKFQGIINIYNTLKAADLIGYTSDRQHAMRNRESARLVIKTDLRVDGEKILDSPDDEAGLDRWLREDGNPIIVDI